MNSIDNQGRFREAMREALGSGAGCPPLESLVDAAFAGSPSVAQQALLSHAGTCASCAAELELAGAFTAPARSAEEAAEVAAVVGRLQSTHDRGAAPAGDAPLARVIPMRRRTASPQRAAWTRWAAAAMIVLGLGLGLRWSGMRLMPQLPDGPATDVVRGGELRLESPLGDLDAAPADFRFRAVPDASRYRLEVRDVAGDAIWMGESRESTFATPRELAARLESHVTYSWIVVALDGSGREIARSSTATFRFAGS